MAGLWPGIAEIKIYACQFSGLKVSSQIINIIYEYPEVVKMTYFSLLQRSQGNIALSFHRYEIFFRERSSP